ncbi:MULTISPECIES: acyl carrier protein [unclassified Crossiella]|uniref:acyl carrier protein n=1 Tax=unclassified Crossiella TaxID=2620835 RepID=UPI001FFE4BB8|nr:MULTISPECIES: acyl carrier protein [unclassified Crossiella]MCK2238016.1 acyl carrier protein [Crossiella sp. S99.2]MCK2255299.1 acyl carrier protein [Crossiella sp. S99.1]
MNYADLAPAVEQQVLATVTELLTAVIGQEYAQSIEIEMDTSFNEDLELESIEFVALSAKLREHYGSRVNFAAFLADKDVAETVGLTVGHLVRYLADCLAGERGAAP